MVDLDMMGINRNSIVQIDWTVEDTIETLMLPGYLTVPDLVLRNGSPTQNWTYDAFWQIISLYSDTGHSVWEIHPHPTSVPSGESSVSLGAGDFICQTFPNPFNPILRISYQVEIPGYIRVKVYDVLGREVATVAEGYHPSGIYRTSFDGRNHSSGIYIVRMESHSATHAVKVLLIK
jgi:hypothetical protein